MSVASIAGWSSCILVACAILSSAYVLTREAVRRRRLRGAMARVSEATSESKEADDVKALAATLQARFDTRTIEIAIETMLVSPDLKSKATGAGLFRELELATTYSKRLREGRRWSDRAHAAEVLGLAGAWEGIPALVAAMRDRFEDAGSVKAAARAALAMLRDPAAVPLLVPELISLEEAASRSVAEALVAFGDLAVLPVLELLDNPNQTTARVWAARILGRIMDRRATDDLIARLHDRDDRLRMTAAEALGSIADARATKPLVRATLRDPAPQVRAHAAAALAKIEGARAVDLLVGALEDPDYATRLRAIEAYEAIRVDDTSHLESALRDPNVEVRRRAGLALERVGYLERTIGELASADPSTRELAYAAVSELGAVGLLDSVAAHMRHESFEVRALVARICGELGMPRVAPFLKNCLSDVSWLVRAAIVQALGRLSAPDTSKAIAALLVDPDESVREAAARALTNFPPDELEEHILELAAAYDAGSVDIRTQMVILISRFGPTVAVPLLLRASSDASETVRLHAVTALGDASREAREAHEAHDAHDAQVAALMARLDDVSLDVRMASITALGTAASTEALEGLLGALAGASPALRDRIAESLSRGARQLLFLRLDELEKSTSLDVRLGVAWTLGKCESPAGVAVLSRFLRDSNELLRASAAGALAKIADANALDALLMAAEDSNGRVRAAVVNALGRAPAGDPCVIRVLEHGTRDGDAFVRDRALVSLALVAGGTLGTRFDELAREAATPARIVAATICGTDRCLSSALAGLALPGALDEVVGFLALQAPHVATAFYSALHLDPTATTTKPIDMPSLVAQYETLVRESLDVTSRRFAVRALEHLSGGESVDALADALFSDPDVDVRVLAVAALRTRRDDAHVRKALIHAIGDPSPEVSIAALHALTGLRTPDVVTALARHLGAGPLVVQTLTESILADIHRDAPLTFLDWMMGIDRPALLVPAVRVLEQMASNEAANLLSELARSRSAALRAAAVRAIGVLPTPDTALLINMAEDPSEEVRIAVVEALGWAGDALTRPLPLRRDPSIRVRVALAVSLGRCEVSRPQSVLSLIDSLLEDSEPAVRAAALASLIALDHPDGLYEFLRIWPTTTHDVRSELRNDHRAAPLIERLKTSLSTNTASPLRKAAITAIEALGGRDVEERLTLAHQDASPELQVVATQALATLEHRRGGFFSVHESAGPHATKAV